MDDRLQRVEAELKEARTKVEESGANVRRLTLILSLFMLTLIGLVVAAAMATDIFKVEYNGTTRMSVSQMGEVAINEDPAASEAAIKILSASAARGDMKFTVRTNDPTNPQVGDLWFNSSEQKFKFYDGFKRTMAIVFLNNLTQVVDDGASTNDGTLGANSSASTDDPTWTQSAKLGGSALSFDGTSDYIRTPINLRLSTGTIDFWFRSGETVAETGYLFGQVNVNPALAAYQYDIDQKLHFWIRNSATTQFALSSNTGINDNQWHHTTMIWGASGAKLYLDGNLHDSNASTIYDDGSTSNFIIGGINNGGTPVYFFNGLIDEFAVWNVALTPAQIAARYNGGAGAELVGNEAGLVSVWHMNDPK